MKITIEREPKEIATYELALKDGKNAKLPFTPTDSDWESSSRRCSPESISTDRPKAIPKPF